ncbi:MAG: hypothetical protein VYD64_10970 [Pseudomonadota bacterium]|nr:hypothetical protein [Pseudomonadota bacterium]
MGSTMKALTGKMLIGAVAALGLAAASATPVQAQTGTDESGGCICTVPTPESGNPIGSVALADGQVLASQGAELLQAGPGTLLFAGSQVLTGTDSNANLSVGTCLVTMGADSEVILSQTDAGICVQMNQVAATPETVTNTNVANAIVPLVAIGGGVAAAIALGGGDDGGASGASN